MKRTANGGDAARTETNGQPAEAHPVGRVDPFTQDIIDFYALHGVPLSGNRTELANFWLISPES